MILALNTWLITRYLFVPFIVDRIDLGMLIDWVDGWVDGWVDDWVVKRMTSWCCIVDVNMIWMDFHMIGWRLDEFEYVGGWKDRWMNGWIHILVWFFEA